MSERTEGEPRIGVFGMVLIGALALFGAVTLVSWFIGWVFGLVRFLLFVVVAVAIIGFVLSIKGRR